VARHRRVRDREKLRTIATLRALQRKRTRQQDARFSYPIGVDVAVAVAVGNRRAVIRLL